MSPTAKAATVPAKSRAIAAPKPVTEKPQNGKSLTPKEDDGSKRKRSRSVLGCYTCRLRRKKCDEGHPTCRACVNLCVKCEYRRPIWWSNTEQRKIQKERVKNKIKHTKLQEKNAGLAAQQRRGFAVPVPVAVPYIPEHDFNRPFFQPPQDPYASHLTTPSFPPAGFGQLTPYEVDIRTERLLFVNDIPTRCDTSTSSFSTFAPPQLESTLPQLPSDDWMPAIPMTHQSLEQCEMQDSSLSSGSPQQSFALMQTSIPVDDCDRPLLNYFVDNVLRLIFPVLETHQKSHERAQAVLQSIETNKSYLHCCLSVAALHFKSTAGNSGDDIDHDIVRHRFDAISHLCQALNSDTEHDRILEATLAMIFFHCSVGGPDEYLPDIPWNDHFQAATNLIHRLDLPATLINCTSSLSPPPFNMTLASWIDILGATMLGKAPQFAHTYRTKHLSGTPSGLRELMGCDDRVMYLISEIACLDALKSEGLIDDIAVCGHVSALAQQLEFTEPADNRIEQPYSTSGAIKPDQLTNNMTAIFRIAARIYLCTLVPGFDRNQPSNINLVEAVCKVLDYIPTGPGGYDRSLVWPLLITGAYASPATSFRRTLESRIISMGDEADFGSFGRMYRLLQEVWRLSDDPFSPIFPLDGSSSDPESFTSSQALDPIYSPPLGSAGMRELKKRDVHWREVMFRNGWRYLLI